MRRLAPAIIAACTLPLLSGGRPPQGAADAPTPSDQLRTRASYGLGLNVGRICREQAIDLDPEAFAEGLRDGIADAEPTYSEEQIAEAMLAFQQQLAEKQEQLLEAVGEKLREQGRAFLRAKAAEPGITRRPSGLLSKVLERGDGPTPEAGDTVLVEFRGTLPNGMLIEDSDALGGAVSVPIDRVIEGWREALLQMKVGSKWELTIPPDLAYGADPPPGSPVPPNAVLVYELKLIAIE